MKNRIHSAAGCKKSVAAARVALVITVGVLCALAIDVGLLAPAVQAQGRSGTAPRISVGTWNTMLQPWFPYEPDVITTTAGTNFDVLALQEVWTEAAKDRIVSNRAVKAAYPYYYYAPALQEAGIAENYVDQFASDYIDCLVVNGIDTRQLDQPSLPIPFGCQALGLNLALTSANAYQCINNTMEQFSPVVNPREALVRCAFAQGVRYSHGGRSGLLLLSKSPIENLELIPYDTFLVHRAVIYATIENTRYAFTQFPKNYLDDVDVLLGPFQYGALQPQLAQDVIGRNPDVIVGDFNSSPDYQPAAHNLFVQNGYTPLFSNITTFCPASTHGSFQPCQPPTAPLGFPIGPRLLDNIYVKGSAAFYRTGVFAERPASDHIGLVAVSTTAPPVVTLKPALSLFPPNHKYVSVNISQMVQSAVDDYDGDLLRNVVIEKVTSDEPENASGNADGNTVDDIVIGRDCRSVQLRSERDETKNGRVYVVTLRLEDSSGNTVRAEYKVSIPIGRIGHPAIPGAVAFAVSSDCC